MSVNFLTLDILYYDFTESLLVFHQFPWFSGSQTEIPRFSMPGTRIIKFHDFPGFSGPVRTLHEYILQQTPDDTRNIYLDNNFVLRFDTKFTTLIWKNTYGSDKGFITISNKTIRLNQLFLKIHNRSGFFLNAGDGDEGRERTCFPNKDVVTTFNRHALHLSIIILPLVQTPYSAEMCKLPPQT